MTNNNAQDEYFDFLIILFYVQSYILYRKVENEVKCC